MKMWTKIKPYIIPCLIPFIVGGLSAYLTRGQMSGFSQPPFAPPAWVFPIAWTILYLLMGISSGIVYHGYHRNRERALVIYALQLVLNFAWSIVFFKFTLYSIANIILAVMIVLITAMILDFYKISPIAGWMNVPYLYWCFFALYLTVGVWVLN